MTSASVVADAGATGKDKAISNDEAFSNSGANASPDRIITEITRLLEPIAGVCSKLPDRIKSYYAQLLLRIPKDLREELTRDNDTRKRKGQPTVEDKIDNTLTMAVAVYDRLNQLEDALRPDASKSGQRQSANGKSAYGKPVNGESAKLGIIARLKSVWSGVRRFCAKQPTRRYRNPYILCAISICLLYFALSIFSWQQWHYYRNENARLRLAADKYHIDSIILRTLYPQATITLSAYEHIAETERAEAAIETFRKNRNVSGNH